MRRIIIALALLVPALASLAAHNPEPSAPAPAVEADLFCTQCTNGVMMCMIQMPHGPEWRPFVCDGNGGG